MKRSLLPLLAAAALLAGCGSSDRSAEHHRVIGPLVPPSPVAFRFSAASNRAFAWRDARRLMRIVVVPPRARPVRAAPKSAPAWFRGELSHTFSGAAIVYRVWVIKAPVVRVVRFIRTHWRPLARPVWPFNTSTHRIGSRPNDDYQFAPIPGRSISRWLNVAMLALPSGRTVVTAQAGDEWVQPPPASAVLPGTVREVEITSRYDTGPPRVRLHVRSRYLVGTLVSWLNGLGLARTDVICVGQVFGEPITTLTFRDANGRPVARGVFDSNRQSPGCTGFSLKVDGHQAPPLATGDLLRRIEQRLNADFSPPKPADVASCLRARGWTVRTTDTVLSARHGGQPTTLVFHLTGKVTTTGRSRPAISRCLRSSPRIGYLG